MHSLQAPLRKLNRDNFSDLHEQQHLARRQLELIQEQLHVNPQNAGLIEKEKIERERCLRVLQSSMFLIGQQSKQQWINQGDHYSKLSLQK